MYMVEKHNPYMTEKHFKFFYEKDVIDKCFAITLLQKINESHYQQIKNSLRRKLTRIPKNCILVAKYSKI